MNESTLLVLLEDMINIIMENVEDERQRAEIYTEMLQSFEAAGLEDYEATLGFDPVFDNVISENYIA